jgi:hypothetical protein
VAAGYPHSILPDDTWYLGGVLWEESAHVETKNARAAVSSLSRDSQAFLELTLNKEGRYPLVGSASDRRANEYAALDAANTLRCRS